MKRAFHRILVTGGAGYGGPCLVPKLLTAGNEVTVFGPCPVCSERIRSDNGFQQKRSVESAIAGLANAFASCRVPDLMADDCYYDVRPQGLNPK